MLDYTLDVIRREAEEAAAAGGDGDGHGDWLPLEHGAARAELSDRDGTGGELAGLSLEDARV